jgi:hypothetical protein
MPSRPSIKPFGILPSLGVLPKDSTERRPVPFAFKTKIMPKSELPPDSAVPYQLPSLAFNNPERGSLSAFVTRKKLCKTL